MTDRAEALFLGRLLARDPGALAAAAAESAAEILDRAERHGVLPIVAHLYANDAGHGFPHRTEFLKAAHLSAAADLVAEKATRQVVDALAAAGIPAVMIKGADLAYGVYERPDLRPRIDTDILIRPSDRGGARDVLSACRYVRQPQSGGEDLMYQEAHLAESFGVRHVVDLHWRVVNPHRFARVLDVDEVLGASEPRPRLSPTARGLFRLHALTLACLHRVAHHYGTHRLIWAYDVRLLAEAMSPADWSEWTEFARERRVAGVCRSGLEFASEALSVPIPADALSALHDTGRDRWGDRSFLDPAARHVNRVVADLRSAGTWRRRAGLLGQHLFPSAEFMRDIYAPASRAPLSALYALRIARGARRWLRRG